MQYKLRFHQKVLLFNSVGQFLILKASYKGKRWDLPGGAVEVPEVADVALFREVSEETGIHSLKDIKPLVLRNAFDSKSKSWVLFVGYTASTSSHRVRLSEEHSKYKWVSPIEARGLRFPRYIRAFINVWSRGEAR